MALRALPFLLRGAVTDSALLRDVGRWIGAHLWRRNAMVSIVVGTTVCVFLTRVVS